MCVHTVNPGADSNISFGRLTLEFSIYLENLFHPSRFHRRREIIKMAPVVGAETEPITY